MEKKKVVDYYFTIKQYHYGHFLLIMPWSITTNYNNAKFPILLEIPDDSAHRSKLFRRFKGWARVIYSWILFMGFSLMLPIFGLNNLMRMYITNNRICLYEFQCPNSPISIARSENIKLMFQSMLSNVFSIRALRKCKYHTINV
jgi:hypothetical protein